MRLTVRRIFDWNETLRYNRIKSLGIIETFCRFARLIYEPTETEVSAWTNRDATLYVNGGSYEMHGFRTDPVVPGDISYPYTLGEDEYFLLGDNQAHALDSRYTQYGVIRRNNIRGVLFASLSPLSSLFHAPGMNSSVPAVPVV